ncbi:TolB family protein [Brachybacterium sacelli]|uniref:Tol biopolymer transport system component n=1 Tax=Brachybacterium sacelli TaxID=173364 RepID=A0ABS4WXF9_9MICO|nr:PD40 domain-containing protein [Brachybacterium sacelli]MBP2380836.1 Tol biopolymer transport system component [Brachybacterium sacelli]
MSDSVPWRHLLPDQSSRIRVWDRASGAVTTVHESAERLYEAPNWTDDGRLLVNGDGKLWFLPADGSADPELLDVPGLPPVNNDHVLAPDGSGVFASASDHHIWHVSFEGAPLRRVTREDGPLHFLHGVSPDGKQLAYVRLEASATIHLLDVEGANDRALTTAPGPADGPAWTPDGSWILFNTEQFSATPGHAQLARIRPDGTGLEQLTDDERVNWFPHVAPTGDVLVYVSFPPGTVGHPADRPVELRLVRFGAWREPTTLVALHGGQGTMNVPSWAPDGSAFAFVDYPV